MNMHWHPLLLRQMRRVGFDPNDTQCGPDGVTRLLDRVSRAYGEAEQDRYRLERSQEIASNEMSELYAKLQASEARLASLLSLSSDWVWEQDATQRFTYVSANARTEVDLSALLVGKRPVHDIAAAEPDAAQGYLDSVEQRVAFRNLTCVVDGFDGRRFYLRLSGEPVTEGAQFRGWRGVCTDVTQAMLAQQRLLRLASVDELTGLPNRSAFVAKLEQALADASMHASSLALLFIDLDQFKNVNDHFGHDYGDELLLVMGSRLSGVLRDTDHVARWGGDEFVVIVQGASEPALSNMAARILAALRAPMRVSGHDVRVSASIGISVYPADGTDVGTLLKSADSAMYAAKSSGKNNFQFFTAALAKRAARALSLEDELRQAIERDELRLYFQPRIAVDTGRPCGMEALLRWQHPRRGLLAPGEFIDVAESTGLIIPIGRRVLYEACRQMRAWRGQGLNPPPCAVNLSARQFEGNVIDDVASALETNGLHSGDLEVEITESLLMANPERTKQVLERIYELGVAIAIDDFGTGHSSLAYLKHFPARTLKIDRSFIKDLPADRDDAAITQAVVAMGHSLGMRVVAEGVETSAQLEFLRRVRCDEAQGYLFARPMHGDALGKWLHSTAAAADY
jgi:diguanylate cyclase (GGDEF)-like protein/PAS domain S-box-containing protein